MTESNTGGHYHYLTTAAVFSDCPSNDHPRSSGEAVGKTLGSNGENVRGSFHINIISNDGGNCDLEGSTYIHPKSETANPGAEPNDQQSEDGMSRIGRDVAAMELGREDSPAGTLTFHPKLSPRKVASMTRTSFPVAVLVMLTPTPLSAIIK
jgi:hypothetical protein